MRGSWWWTWRLVNQGYLNPERLDEIRWRRQRQKALERSISSSEDAYVAIEAMLAPLEDPYTRLLRPDDYAALKDSTTGNLSGVGLQLGPGPDNSRVVVISALDGSPAADAGVTSGAESLRTGMWLIRTEGTANVCAATWGPRFC